MQSLWKENHSINSFGVRAEFLPFPQSIIRDCSPLCSPPSLSRCYLSDQEQNKDNENRLEIAWARCWDSTAHLFKEAQVLFISLHSWGGLGHFSFWSSCPAQVHLVGTWSRRGLFFK